MRTLWFFDGQNRSLSDLFTNLTMKEYLAGDGPGRALPTHTNGDGPGRDLPAHIKDRVRAGNSRKWCARRRIRIGYFFSSSPRKSLPPAYVPHSIRRLKRLGWHLSHGMLTPYWHLLHPLQCHTRQSAHLPHLRGSASIQQPQLYLFMGALSVQCVLKPELN